MQELSSPTKLGRYQLSNRLVVETHCRRRAVNYCPSLDTHTYYAQFASAGLIISEPLLVDLPSISGDSITGLFERSHIEAWREVNKAVHEEGGLIFAQLWHSANLPCLHSLYPHLKEQLPLDLSCLDRSNIMRQAIVEQFRQGAQFALAADFDGVEIHGALNPLSQRIASNRPSPDYMRAEGIYSEETALLLEITDVLSSIWNSDRIGVFLSCSAEFCDERDLDLEATLYEMGNAFYYNNIAYVHLCESEAERSMLEDPKATMLKMFRSVYSGTIIFNSKEICDGQDVVKEGLKVIDSSEAALLSFSDSDICVRHILDQIGD